MSDVATYTVEGMTCGHCVNSVSAEIGRIGGVTQVQVDLASGLIEVTSNEPVPTDAIKQAVEEAGYALIP
jgi:copper chaperone